MSKNDVFIKVADCIFSKKNQYQQITDNEKIDSFYKINQKFACAYPKHAHFLNSKFIDKSSAIDIWFNYFLKKEYSTPSWYWTNVEYGKKTSKKINDKKLQIFRKYNPEFNDTEIDFLIKYYEQDILDEVEKLSKFEE